jgi:hypothetical protein
MSNRHQSARAELRVFYGVVLVLALFGQSSGASSWLIPPDANPVQRALYWLLVIAFVAVLELGAVVLLRRAETQRRAGERAWIAILTAIALALGAAALSWAGHWGPTVHEQIQAWAFAGSTLLGVIVWAIMADLSIAEHVAQHRAVREAVRRYIKALTMDNAEKAVLIATMNIPLITKWILDGPDAVEGQGHERDLRIARILATAIDPSTWHGHQATPAAPEPVQAPRPTKVPVKRVAAQAPSPAVSSQQPDAFAAVEKAFVELYVSTGKRPGVRALEDAVQGAKKKSAIHTWMQNHPGLLDKLTVEAKKIRAGQTETAEVSA